LFKIQLGDQGIFLKFEKSTNDAGLGALKELGLKVKCQSKTEIYEPEIFFGKNLIEFHSVDASNLIRNIQIDIACDVNSQFCGEHGATFVAIRNFLIFRFMDLKSKIILA
jgi:glycerate kinase